ncbi:hypothetical protein KR222_008959 [Zaprionus bogoriensis]|nr:hypothetical protein KR222_008959 [Zaprionus bogoriensis]
MFRSFPIASLLLLLLLGLSLCLAQDAESEDQQAPLPTRRPGHYLHQLHGAGGLYTPDNSGKYRHDPRPYDGGYGDRGQPYADDLRGIFRQAEEQLAASVQEANEEFALGPRDHLRFMIDFNYNGTGWQIIQFEWVRDDDDQRQFSYVNENKLWETTEAAEQSKAYDYSQPNPNCDPGQHTEQDRTRINSEQDPVKVQSTINEVLEYIQRRIVPKIN